MMIIGDRMFANNQISQIQIPYSVSKIGASAFSKNNITTIDLANVSVITAGAFDGLKQIQLPSSLTFIDKEAFKKNVLKERTLPERITVVENGAFMNNELTKLMISNSNVLLKVASFMNNNIQDVTIPTNMMRFNVYAFAENPLKTVTLLGSNTKVQRDSIGTVKKYGTVKKQINTVFIDEEKSTIWSEWNTPQQPKTLYFTWE